MLITYVDKMWITFLTRYRILVKIIEPYIETRYIAVRYNIDLDYRKCKVFLMTKYPIIKVAKMQKIQVIVIFPHIT